MMDEERRQHRRLAIHLPLECYPSRLGPERAVRTVTGNISTGGLYFEVDLLDEVAVPEVRSLLNIGLTVPPGDGHFPYEGRVTTIGEVVRCDPPRKPPLPDPDAPPPRMGVAVRFREPLKLAF